MRNAAILSGATLLALSMIPSCPAPIGLIITGLVAPLAGNLIYIGLKSGGVSFKREFDGMVKVPRWNGYPGVSQEAYDLCKNSNSGAHVTVTQTADASFRVDGVTPECMDLAALFTGSGTVYPCGTACLQYNNLSPSDAASFKNTIQSLL